MIIDKSGLSFEATKQWTPRKKPYIKPECVNLGNINEITHEGSEITDPVSW